jgi:hypothetical protein
MALCGRVVGAERKKRSKKKCRQNVRGTLDGRGEAGTSHEGNSKRSADWRAFQKSGLGRTEGCAEMAGLSLL